MFVAVSVGVAIATPLARVGSRAAGLALVGLAACGLLSIVSLPTHAPAERTRPWWVVAILAVVQLGFWIAFGRLEQTALAIASARTDVLGLWPSPGTIELLFVAPMLVLAPLVFVVWRLLARVALEPSPAIKFGLGFVLLALSGLSLAVGVEWSLAQGDVGMAAVAACATTLGLAALCLGPTSLAAVRECGTSSAWAAGWVLCVLLGRATGAWTAPTTLAPEPVFAACMSVGSIAVIAGVALGCSWRPLAQLTSAKPAAGPRRVSALQPVRVP
ncbi:hypothetical protein DB30_06429 [Enhygromyxa salina]|uniref:Uncharacterized protein n=1 Tax=Enhygromyxa salina TaxID=215803 RepID=A0A0C1ZUK0_9BACT|nr:hypothetical protein [Enhygromyxa salina]KIG14703.1 hypothetical protein DB30_06429 [Enhygromyxa salina]